MKLKAIRIVERRKDAALTLDEMPEGEPFLAAYSRYRLGIYMHKGVDE